MTRQGTPYEIGDVHNDWTIIGPYPKHKNGSVMVMVRCVCDKEEPRLLSYLKNGRIKRCAYCTKKFNSKKRFCLCGCGQEIKKTEPANKKYLTPECRDEHYKEIKAGVNGKKAEHTIKLPKRLDVRRGGICLVGGQCSNYDDCLNLSFKGFCSGKADPSDHDQLYSAVNHLELEV